MKRAWKVVRHPTVATILIITVLLLGWNLAMAVIAPAKVSGELSSAVASGDPKLRIAVTLNFEPERFHTLYLQDYGNVMKVDGDTVMLRSVAPADVSRIARLYWVNSLDLQGSAS
ncbi:hypothetical protein H490_0106635 [Leucobacter sp. UCD-THU]|uniref:hypothetical protein n=1 Tax=Leucobacter sp. UCD-THU TaxID=1292023 RepID=UPI00035D1F33|nr:hypothetical protein [Leucobacter sp. UCD-THU]EYT54578.1 hypothetical protein H490_0106635 [Leucobacter sp. UCD-THU]